MSENIGVAPSPLHLADERTDKLADRLKDAVDAYNSLSPVDRALHDADQRRSFVRGQCGRDPGPDVLADEVRRLRAQMQQMIDALVTAKRELWDRDRHLWNLSDWKNFASVQKIDAALMRVRTDEPSEAHRGTAREPISTNTDQVIAELCEALERDAKHLSREHQSPGIERDIRAALSALAAQQREIEGLRAERDAIVEGLRFRGAFNERGVLAWDVAVAIDSQRARATAAEAEVAGLKEKLGRAAEALRPFADAIGGEDEFADLSAMRLGDFRRAKAAHTELTQHMEGGNDR
jgi:hypothetical protein